MGNTFVIYASIRYDAFGMDYATVHMIQQLAAADLIFILTYLVPMMVTHMAHGWVLGRTMCVITGMFCSIPVLANINFILAVSIHRYMRCKFPLDITWLNKRKRIRCLCLGLWIYSCLFILYVCLSKAKVSFKPKLAGCQFNFSTSIWNFIVVLLTTVVPFILILAINIGLWLFVRNIVKKTRTTARVDCSDKKNKCHPKCKNNHQALIITTCITAFFIVCWFPTVIRFVLSAVIGEENIPNFLEKGRYVYFIGTYGNPILYTMISKKFRKFLWKHMKGKCRENFGDPLHLGNSQLASLATARSPVPTFRGRQYADTASLRGTPPGVRIRELLTPIPPRCRSR